MGFIASGATNQGDKRIPIRSIISVELGKEPTSVLMGGVSYIRFATAADEEKRADFHAVRSATKAGQLFNDPKLFVKVYALLSRHKFKQPVRRRIMQYFDNCITSIEIIENAVKIMEELDKDLLLAHELE